MASVSLTRAWRRIGLALGPAWLAASASAELWIVDLHGQGDFGDIQTAITQASDGDVILVRTGFYPPFGIDGKTLTVAAHPGCTVEIAGTIEVRNLTAGKFAVIAGLASTGPVSYFTPGAGVKVANCAGFVRLEQCTFRGAPGDEDNYPGGTGGVGGDFTASTRVLAVRSNFLGGAGYSQSYACYDCIGGNGGDGIRSVNAGFSLYDCAVRGGDGGDTGQEGGHGGFGADVSGFGLFAAGTSFEGGAGGYADDYVVSYGGNGGDGLAVDGAAQAQLLDNEYIGGEEGYSYLGNHGEEGEPRSGAGVFNDLPGTARTFVANLVAPDASSLLLQVSGEPGDRVWIRTAAAPSFLYHPELSGVWTLATNPVGKMPFYPLGTLPASGTMSVELPIVDIAGSLPAAQLFIQGWVKPASGGVILGSPLELVAINCDAARHDCNSNGAHDLCDLVFGASADCDANGSPDECDVDCNANLVPDACDIATQTSDDCDVNGVPDECESLPDCNQNGVADACDLGSGASEDCNDNLVPDECDLPDCNGNDRPDSCDIALGFSDDFNHDGVPDECQIGHETWYVDDSAAPGGDGSSALPFQNLHAAFAVSITGDTIVVRDGTYVSGLNKNLQTGGRGLTVRSENGPDNCVVDCQSAGYFMNLASSPDPVAIEGITVRNAALSAILTLGSNVTIRDCRFLDCRAVSNGIGGALVLSYSRGSVRGCRFERCWIPASGGSGSVGGAIYLVTNGGIPSQSRFDVFDCWFADCLADFGGALATAGSGSAYVSHCTFAGNTAREGGGALQCRGFVGSGGQGTTVVDSLFVHNSADEGGAVEVWKQSPSGGDVHARFVHCTMAFNSATSRGGALWIENALPLGSRVWLEDSIVWGDAAPSGFEIGTQGQVTVRYCDLKGGINNILVSGGTVVWGQGNFALNPQYQNPAGADGDPLTHDDNDYRMAANSPCIDRGDNSLAALDELDLDGDGNTSEPLPFDLDFSPRFADDPAVPDQGAGIPPITDIGCYER